MSRNLLKQDMYILSNLQDFCGHAIARDSQYTCLYMLDHLVPEWLLLVDSCCIKAPAEQACTYS